MMSLSVFRLLVAALLLHGILCSRLVSQQVSEFTKEEPEDLEETVSSNSCPYHPKSQPLNGEEFSSKISPALDTVSSYLSSLVDPETRPAISANVVYKDEIVWEGNFGQISKTNTTCPSGDTIYRIASISKIFPTIFLFKLWEDDLVRLDDLLVKYAPNFRIGNPFGSKPNLTLHDIASQISGIPSLLPFDLLKRDIFKWNASFEEMLQTISKEVLVVDPGTTCYYSNLAYALLAHTLERNFTDDGDFEKWVEKNVIQPLKLNNTALELTNKVKSKMAVGYYSTGEEAELLDLNWFRPAGNYFSSARDLAAVTMSFMETSQQRILKHETLSNMLRPVQKCGYGYLSENTGSPWEINEQHTYQIVRKDGDIDGYSSTMAMIPDLDLSFTVLMSGQRPEDVAASVLDKLLPVFVEVLRSKAYPVAPAVNPAKFVGYYQIDNIQYWNVTANDNKLSMTNPYVPESRFKTVGLSYTDEDILELTVLGGMFPCKIGASSLEGQNGALLHFKNLTNGVFNEFDMPGLNIFGFKRAL